MPKNPSKPQMRALQTIFPVHGDGAGLGTRLLHKDLAEPLLSMQLGNSVKTAHRLPLKGTTDFGTSVRHIS